MIHGLTYLAKWLHVTVPDTGGVRVNEDLSRNCLRQGHCQYTRPRKEIRSTRKMLMLNRDYFPITAKFLTQEAVIPLSQIMMYIHQGVRPVRGVTLHSTLSNITDP